MTSCQIISCDICGKEFTNARSLVYHKANRVCDRFKIECDRCFKRFLSRKALKYHIDHNVCKSDTIVQSEKKSKPKIVLKSKTTLVDSLKKLSKDELIERLVEKVIENKVLKENPRNVTNIHNNYYVNYTGDNAQELTYKLIVQRDDGIMWNAIAKNTSSYLVYLVRYIFGHPEKWPELCVAYVPNIRLSYAKMYNNGRYQTYTRQDVLNIIIDLFLSVSQRYVDDNMERLLPYINEYIEQNGTVERGHAEHALWGILSDLAKRMPEGDRVEFVLELLSSELNGCRGLLENES